ncbi:MAG: hypothetical protein QOH74_1651 [Gaiellales bacterium]|nr:hypothetical protein [Gaiellales bacterium]
MRDHLFGAVASDIPPANRSVWHDVEVSPARRSFPLVRHLPPSKATVFAGPERASISDHRRVFFGDATRVKQTAAVGGQAEARLAGADVRAPPVSARRATGNLLRMTDREAPNEGAAAPNEQPIRAAGEPRETSPPVPNQLERPQGMLPGRERRRSVLERGFVRIVATGGIIGIDTVLGAVLVSQDVAGWIVGLAVGLTSVILAALLWSSRQL